MASGQNRIARNCPTKVWPWLFWSIWTTWPPKFWKAWPPQPRKVIANPLSVKQLKNWQRSIARRVVIRLQLNRSMKAMSIICLSMKYLKMFVWLAHPPAALANSVMKPIIGSGPVIPVTSQFLEFIPIKREILLSIPPTTFRWNRNTFYLLI